MIASEFLKVYPREMSENQIHRDTELDVVRDVQRYSYLHGLVVHAAVQGAYEEIPPLLPQISQFEENTTFHEVEGELLRAEGGWQYRNEVNFHCLNEHMTELWSPLAHQGEWPGNNRQESLNVAMNSLGVMGMQLYHIREAFVKQNGTEALYTGSQKNIDFVKRFTGALQEIDAAIIAIGAIRRMDSLTVVPAPLQFERDSEGANADLLVVDTEDPRMLGIQVKTTLTKSIQDNYDKERIIFIDGDTDLNNIRVVRVKKGTSKTAVKPWPGIIATSRVHNIKMHGKHQHLHSSFSPMIMQYKMLARNLVGSLRVDTRDICETIAARIKNAL